MEDSINDYNEKCVLGEGVPLDYETVAYNGYIHQWDYYHRLYIDFKSNM